MILGKIVEIIRPKGYGFIESEDGERIFFHQRWLKNLKFRNLNVGDEVAFLIKQGPRGPRAHNMMLPEDIPPTRQERIAELLFK